VDIHIYGTVLSASDNVTHSIGFPKLKFVKTARIPRIEYSLFFVPQRTMLCERVLEEEGVLGDITLGEYAMEWIPFEDDLISMELDNNTWKELNLVKIS
jgi:hypothetical protein